MPEITLKWFLQLLLLGGRSSARSRTPTPLFMQLTDLCKHCTSGHHQDLAQRPSLLPQPPAGCTQGLPQPLVWLVTVAGPALLLWHGGTAPSATTLLCFLLSCPLLMLFNTENPRAGMGSRTRSSLLCCSPSRLQEEVMPWILKCLTRGAGPTRRSKEPRQRSKPPLYGPISAEAALPLISFPPLLSLGGCGKSQRSAVLK